MNWIGLGVLYSADVVCRTGRNLERVRPRQAAQAYSVQAPPMIARVPRAMPSASLNFHVRCCSRHHDFQRTRSIRFAMALLSAAHFIGREHWHGEGAMWELAASMVSHSQLVLHRQTHAHPDNPPPHHTHTPSAHVPVSASSCCVAAWGRPCARLRRAPETPRACTLHSLLSSSPSH